MPVIETQAAARGRLRGARVGTTAGAGWALYGVLGLPMAAKSVGVVAVISAWLLSMYGAGRLARAADARLRATAAERGGDRRALWFVVIAIGEIVLMNVAVWLLRAAELHVYRVAAIALVVGLHFAPLAILFRLRAFWGTAIAMTMLAGLAAAALRFAVLPPATTNMLLAFGSALALWITAASGFADVRAAVARARASA